jgi:nucleoside-diphosphate-sugar epimerase
MTPQKTLFTGATGYIGSRLCERMRLHWGLTYRAMVHSYTRAARIARLDSELVKADLLDRDSVVSAAEGCDAIVHLAFGADGRTETRNILHAALRQRVKRFVHISSMAVHGFNPGPAGAREETAKIGRYNSEYSDEKAEVEEMVQKAIDRDGLPGVILRPTVVYGPHSGFVLRVINEARSGVVTLIDGGAGICNAVYVDDVCSAIHAGLTSDAGVGLAFFVNGGDRVTWKDFNTTFATILSPSVEFVSLPSAEILAHWAKQKPTLMTNVREAGKLAMSREFHQQLARVPVVRATIKTAKETGKKVLSRERVRQLKGEGVLRLPPQPARYAIPDDGRVSREVFSVYFEVERAKKVLGWAPAYTFPQGAALTREWLRFARFVPGA